LLRAQKEDEGKTFRDYTVKDAASHAIAEITRGESSKGG
jgi:hypothetical protein